MERRKIAVMEYRPGIDVTVCTEDQGMVYRRAREGRGLHPREKTVLSM